MKTQTKKKRTFREVTVDAWLFYYCRGDAVLCWCEQITSDPDVYHKTFIERPTKKTLSPSPMCSMHRQIHTTSTWVDWFDDHIFGTNFLIDTIVIYKWQLSNKHHFTICLWCIAQISSSIYCLFLSFALGRYLCCDIRTLHFVADSEHMTRTQVSFFFFKFSCVTNSSDIVDLVIKFFSVADVGFI